MKGRNSAHPPRPSTQLARVISKRGLASRTEASELILSGRVRVNGIVVMRPDLSVDPECDVISIDNEARLANPVYLMLNKPRGLITSRADEQGRDTVYTCLDPDLPFVAPVGRLDKASEGLLLFSNDPVWAARLLDPAQHLPRTYHVQVDGLPDTEQLLGLHQGFDDPELGHLALDEVAVIRQGQRNAWLEVRLRSGKNRQIRRVCAAQGLNVKRLIRVALGCLQLGDLGKGQWRMLNNAEREALHDMQQ